jgi:DNA polymerase-3 subunit delta'
VGHGRAIGVLEAQRRAGRLAHAYCLTGDEGIGKTTLARALAEELLLTDARPIRLDAHPDFWVDDRAEAVSIDEIRFHPEKGAPAHEQSLQQFLNLKPFIGSIRVALLANAERMTEAAQNCLLKTLEEPPPGTVLVITTAYPDHLLPTCLSRCQFLPLSPVSRSTMIEWLRESNAEDPELLAALAQGRPGWAHRAIRDPEWVRGVERWATELSSLAFEDADVILAYAMRFGQGAAADQRLIAAEALRAFTGWLREAMLLQAGISDAMLPASRRTALEDWVRRVPPGHLRSSLAAAQRTQLLIDQNVNPRFAMEILLLDFRLRRSA